MKYCSECGTKILDNAKFCINCGMPLSPYLKQGEQRIEENSYSDAGLEKIKEKGDSLKKDYIEGLTILGGEPFEPENQEQVLDLIKEVRKEVPNKTIWVYSGFTYEELMGIEQSRASLPSAKEILNLVDILVDGKFVEELKDIRLKFRGSSNQRIIDMKETNKQGKIVLSSLNK